MYFSQCNNINLDSLNISGNRGFNGAGILARITENFTLSNSHISFGSVPMEGGGVYMSIGTNVTFENVEMEENIAL